MIRPRAALWALLLLASLLQGAAAAQTVQEQDRIARGRYLATIGDCIACHTAPGGPEFAGGRAIETPFGKVITANLTPDLQTGIGAMSDAAFLRALQHGEGRAGLLYPALPYPYFTRVATEDLLAIRAYLATLAPVRNPVPETRLAFPFDLRPAMAAWNALYFSPGPFRPRPGQSAEWNRGAYLVEGLGHCGACHTPKTALGGDRAGRALQGGMVQDWMAPSLAGDLRSGLGAWTGADIVAYLRSGHTLRAAASGPMAEVVERSTAHLAESDLWAIATYLKSAPPAGPPPPAPLAQDEPAMRAGAAIYADLCAACHTGSGAGVAGLFPRLAGSAIVQAQDPWALLRMILAGARSAATDTAPTGPAMPGLGWKLNDAEAAAVATYVRNAWGNAAGAVSPGAATAVRQRLAGHAERD